jgi:hypothetical protein
MNEGGKKNLKKLAVVLCAACVFFAAGLAFAADGIDTHEAGFGPVVKGLQLGVHTTVREAIEYFSSIVKNDEPWHATLYTPLNGDIRANRVTLRVEGRLRGGSVKYKVIYNMHIPSRSSGSLTLEEFIKEAESHPDFRLFIASDWGARYYKYTKSYTVARRKNGPLRYENMTFGSVYLFNAGEMSDAACIENLMTAYPLLAETKLKDTVSEISGGRDGWCYWIENGYLYLTVVDMNYDYHSDSSSFN